MRFSSLLDRFIRWYRVRQRLAYFQANPNNW